jgi:hypothetical protein
MSSSPSESESQPLANSASDLDSSPENCFVEITHGDVSNDEQGKVLDKPTDAAVDNPGKLHLV